MRHMTIQATSPFTYLLEMPWDSSSKEIPKDPQEEEQSGNIDQQAIKNFLGKGWEEFCLKPEAEAAHHLTTPPRDGSLDYDDAFPLPNSVETPL